MTNPIFPCCCVKCGRCSHQPIGGWIRSECPDCVSGLIVDTGLRARFDRLCAGCVSVLRLFPRDVLGDELANLVAGKDRN